MRLFRGLRRHARARRVRRVESERLCARMDREGSKFIGAVSGGWPQILANLKSLIEAGSVILPSMEFKA